MLTSKPRVSWGQACWLVSIEVDFMPKRWGFRTWEAARDWAVKMAQQLRLS